MGADLLNPIKRVPSMVSIGVCSLKADEEPPQLKDRRSSSIGQLMVAANECMEIASTIAVKGVEASEADEEKEERRASFEVSLALSMPDVHTSGVETKRHSTPSIHINDDLASVGDEKNEVMEPACLGPPSDPDRRGSIAPPADLETKEIVVEPHQNKDSGPTPNDDDKTEDSQISPPPPFDDNIEAIEMQNIKDGEQAQEPTSQTSSHGLASICLCLSSACSGLTFLVPFIYLPMFYSLEQFERDWATIHVFLAIGLGGVGSLVYLLFVDWFLLSKAGLFFNPTFGCKSGKIPTTYCKAMLNITNLFVH